MTSGPLGTRMEGFWYNELRDDLLIVHLDEDILQLATNLGRFDRSIGILEEAADLPESRAVLLLAGKRCFSPERCDAFWEEIADLNKDTNRGESSAKPSAELWTVREENAFRRFICTVRNLPRPVLIAFEGDVAFPFLGLALACDVRIASRETVFHNRFLELGLPAAGGISYFLPLYVGFHKASEILMQTSELDSQSAFSLGLVDEIVPPENFEDEAIAVGRDWAGRPVEVIAAMKRQLNVHLSDLDKHFDVEIQEIQKAIRRLDESGPKPV